MTTPHQSIRRIPVPDVKIEQKRLLDSTGLVSEGYTGTVTLKLDYHRGSLNSMQIDTSVRL